MIPHAPGVQMQPIPEDAVPDDSDKEEESNPDKRISIMSRDKRVVCDEEFSDSEDEGEGGRRDVHSHKNKRQKSDDTSKEKESIDGK